MTRPIIIIRVFFPFFFLIIHPDDVRFVVASSNTMMTKRIKRFFFLFWWGSARIRGKKTEKFTAKTTTTRRNEEESDMRTVCVCVWRVETLCRFSTERVLPYIPPRPPTKAGRYVEKGKNEIKKEKEDSASSSFSSVEKKKWKKIFVLLFYKVVYEFWSMQWVPLFRDCVQRTSIADWRWFPTWISPSVPFCCLWP